MKKAKKTQKEVTRKIKVAVVYGGPSTEAVISRKTGQSVLNALSTKKHIHAVGLEFSPKDFLAQLKKIKPDVVFNAIHGEFGEDGQLWSLVTSQNIACTGCDLEAAVLTFNKIIMKRMLWGAGVQTPIARIFTTFDRRNKKDLTNKILRKYSLPLVIKAPSQGSSLGVHVVTTREEIAPAVDDAFRYGDEILVEKFIEGKEVTMTVMGHDIKRNHRNITVLPTIEIRTKSGRYDYETKYTPGASTHICPADLPERMNKRLQKLASTIFEVFCCSGVIRIDAIIADDDVPYVIDINTVPGMTETSLVPDSVRAAGTSFEDFCEMLVMWALEDKP